MASYGTARTYAQVLGEPAVARLLEQTLKEEKAANRTLTGIAEQSVNEDAATEWQSQAEDGPLMRSAEWAGRTSGVAVRQLRRAASAVGVAHDRSPRRASTGIGRARRQRTTGRRRRAVTKKR